MTPINPILETNQSRSGTKGPIDPLAAKRFLRIAFLFPVKRAFRLHFLLKEGFHREESDGSKIKG